MHNFHNKMVSTGPFLIIPDIIRYGRYLCHIYSPMYLSKAISHIYLSRDISAYRDIEMPIPMLIACAHRANQGWFCIGICSLLIESTNGHACCALQILLFDMLLHGIHIMMHLSFCLQFLALCFIAFHVEAFSLAWFGTFQDILGAWAWSSIMLGQLACLGMVMGWFGIMVHGMVHNHPSIVPALFCIMSNHPASCRNGPRTIPE